MTLGRDRRVGPMQTRTKVAPCAFNSASRPTRLLASFAACAMLFGSGYSSLAFGQTTLLGGVPVLYTPSSVPAATASQNVRPQPFQRATMLDGTVKAGAGIAFSSGNPFASDPGPSARLGDFDLLTGAYAPFAIDFAGSARGDVGWTIGRTYSQVQTTGSAQHVSDGAQGLNWFQASLPELRYLAAAGASGLDAVQVVLGADRLIEFQQSAESATTFEGVNGTGGVLQKVAGTGGEPDTFIYHLQNGTRIFFFGGNTEDGMADYQLWKIVAADGRMAFTGDATSASAAVENRYDESTNTLYAYDGSVEGATGAINSAGRRYSYSYASAGAGLRLVGVTVHERTGANWTSPRTVAQIAYTYYGASTQWSSTQHGLSGQLESVSVTTPTGATGSAQNLTRTTYYRYYTGTYNSTTNPGNPGDLKLVMGAEGVRSYEEQNTTAVTAASDSALLAFSEAQFKYNSGDHRVALAVFNGECGCGGGANGEYAFDYTTNSAYSNTSGSYDQTWATRTRVEQPDGSFVVYQFDEAGQCTTRVLSSLDPQTGGSGYKEWVTHVERSSQGWAQRLYTPASVTSYTWSSGGGDGTVTLRSTGAGTGKGLQYQFTRETSAPLAGYVLGEYVAEESTTAVGSGTKTRAMTYTSEALSVGSISLRRPLIATNRGYFGTGTGDYDETTYSYSFWSGGNAALALKQATTTLPAVTSTNNGPNTAVVVKDYYLQDGSLAMKADPTFSSPALNRLTKYAVNEAGQTTAVCRDVNQSDVATGTGNAWNATIPSGGFSVDSSYTYDPQGRSTGSLTDGVSSAIQTYTYRKATSSGLLVTITFPYSEPTDPPSSAQWLFGPAQVSVTNQAGKLVASMVVSFPSESTAISSASWGDLVDENAADASAVVKLDYLGTSGSSADDVKVSRLVTNTYTSSGHQLVSSRAYYGTGSGDYDETLYTYDAMGRQVQVQDPTDTLTTRTFDAAGRMTATAIGTNSTDMTTVEEIEYDGGMGGGNGLVTKRIRHVDESAHRDYEYLYDLRGRLKVSKVPVDSGISAGVHTLTDYDNLNRVVAVAGYSSAGGLTASSSAVSTTASRVSLSETAYDEQGRAWKATRHKINQSSGASADTLVSKNWYDASGRVVATAGATISKTDFDALGRMERTFTIAKFGGTAYSDIYSASTGKVVLTDDVVVEESRQYLDESTGLPLMQVAVSRAHDLASTVTGALISSTDLSAVPAAGSTPTWRANITANWYDARNRTTDTAAYGTNGGSAIDRDSVTAAPSRSDTVLVQSTAYAPDGTVLETTDPKGIKARTVLDDAGRMIKTIANYVDGTPGGGKNGDEDQVVTYAYTNGLMTAMTADLPSSEADQTTAYAYGVEKGAGTGQSDVASNRLIRAVTYPVGGYSDAADRQVTYAYNAQGQQRRIVDQAGNVTTTSYDLAGRETSRAAGVVTGFVSDVQRIQTAYDARGLVSSVTQYDSQSGGTALDEVAYAYDDWGNLTNFDQDADSSFGGSTSGRWGVAYSWEKAGASTTPNLLRRVCETLPGGAGLCYGYGSSGSIDSALSRVTTLTLGTTDVAQYEYRGIAQVAGISLPEAGHKSNQYLDAAPSSYGNIDAFGRFLASEWVRSSNGAWTYHTNISYDRNSNITQVIDGVHTLQGWSAQYSMDGLNRVIAADQGLMVESGGTYSVDADWRWRKELWTLNQTGNWSSHSVGDNSGGNNELAETGAFNTANEWTGRTRTTPSTSPTSDTLAYDKVGNMTESGKGEKYVYDGFGRLREVYKWVLTAPSTWGWRIHAAYRYNGLGMRLTHEINVDNDADIDVSDVKTHFAYDENWRVVATYASPTAAGPTERWVYHSAGLAGTGGSSYIDSVVLRDRDVVTVGDGSTFGDEEDVMEERVYVLQNWRADVVATLGRTGTLIEWIQYTPYGMAVTNPPGNADFNGDGGVDGGDTEAFFLAWEGGLPSADINNDGGVDTADVAAFEDIWEAGETPQSGLCMLTAIRVGYAGYQWDGSVNHDRTVSGAMAGLYHVRYRAYDPELGRWTRRDPLEYYGQPTSAYAYCMARALLCRDPLGLFQIYYPIRPIVSPRLTDSELIVPLPRSINPRTPRFPAHWENPVDAFLRDPYTNPNYRPGPWRAPSIGDPRAPHLPSVPGLQPPFSIPSTWPASPSLTIPDWRPDRRMPPESFLVPDGGEDWENWMYPIPKDEFLYWDEPIEGKGPGGVLRPRNMVCANGASDQLKAINRAKAELGCSSENETDRIPNCDGPISPEAACARARLLEACHGLRQLELDTLSYCGLEALITPGHRIRTLLTLAPIAECNKKCNGSGSTN